MRLLFFVLLLSGAALAIDDGAIARASVKLTSRRCNGGAEYRGSGLVFESARRYFVLTSDHVVWHQDEGYCHRLFSPELGARRLRFRGADWGAGLALLELAEGPPPSKPLTLQELTPAAPIVGEKVAVLGFPFDSEALVEDRRGEVLSAGKASDLFAWVPSLIELRGAHGEFGMSGGAVFTQRGGFLGLLTHQIVEQENFLLLLPAARVAAFLDEALADPEHYRPCFHTPPWLQQAKQPNWIISGNLMFMVSCGSGGRCTASISLQGKTPSRPVPDPGGEMIHWLEEIKARPSAKGGALLGFRRRGKIPLPEDILRPRSAVELFRMLMRDDLEALTASRVDSYSDKTVKMAAEVHQLAHTARQLLRPGLLTSYPARDLVEDVQVICGVLPSGAMVFPHYLDAYDWFRVRDSDLARLVSSKAWPELEAAAGGEAMDLRRRLDRVREMLAELSL